jgi:pimeloyl-ACP methyl ester carboxylesterase
MAELELEDVTLVGNDTGGAICQLVAAERPARLARLVLTPCDAFENFLPPAFRYLQVAARVPGAITLLMQTMRPRTMRRAPIAYGWLTKHRVDDAVLDAWVEPIMRDRGVRRDAVKVLRGISKRYTLEAAERLRDFDRPVLLAWAPEDRFFTWKYAERLAAVFPNARLERIEDARTFVSEDQPERLAELVAGFVGAAGPGAPRAGERAV